MGPHKSCLSRQLKAMFKLHLLLALAALGTMSVFIMLQIIENNPKFWRLDCRFMSTLRSHLFVPIYICKWG